MATIEFRGETVEYDEKCAKSYKWQKLISRNDISAIELLFFGHDEDVAALFDDDSDAMQELVLACITASKQAKN